MPAPAAHDPYFRWVRYWTPWDKSIHWEWGHDQYLADPEDGIGRHLNASIRTLDQLTAENWGCLTLCGEPGMGKSWTLEEWRRRQGGRLLSVLFREVPDRQRFDELVFESEEWKRWQGSEDTLMLVIDGLDEGIIKIPGFVEYLTGRLRELPRARLRVMLVVRSLEWPASEGGQLMDLWRGTGRTVGVFELCPLRRKDVAMAATTSGVKPHDFLMAIRREGLVALATRPLTLKMLLREYVRGGKFAGTRGELIRLHVRELCNEIEPARRERLLRLDPSLARYSAEDVYRASRWLAAILLLCGKSAVYRGKTEDRQPGDLEGNAGGVAGGEMGIGAPPPDGLVRLALQCPLFSARGPDRAGFYHQVLAEVLAADFLRELPLVQQLQLLCNRDRFGRFVEPALAEVAAWLAVDSEGFRGHLVAHEPEILLRGDAAVLPAAVKAELVDRLLAQARNERLFEPRDEKRFYHGLRHPGLPGQLRGCLNDRSANLVARRLALAIAGACKVQALLDDVLMRLRDPADGAIHRSAAPVIRELMRKADVRRIAEIARDTTFPDSYTRFWCVTALLDNRHWALRDALPYLDGLLNRYDSHGYLLAQYAEPADTTALLAQCGKWPGGFHGHGRFGPLAKAALALTLAQWSKPTIRRMLAQVWFRAGRTGAGMDDDLAKQLRARCDAEPANRRAFIRELARVGKFEFHVTNALVTQVVHADDFPWLLQIITRTGGRERRNLAELIAWLYRMDRDHPWLGLLQTQCASVPELRKHFAWLRTWPLDHPESLVVKENYYQNQARAQEHARPVEEELEPREVWERDLAQAETAKPSWWVAVSHDLFYGDNNERHELEADLMKSPGWKFHGTKARRSLRALARLFLEEETEHVSQVGQLTNYDIAAYRAIFLLRAEWRNEGALRAAIRARWIPAILGWWGQQDSNHPEMVRRAYRLNPAAVLAFQRQEFAQEAQGNPGYIMSPRKYALCWDRPMTKAMIQWATSHHWSAVNLGSLTRELIDVNDAAAWELWRALRAKKERNAAGEAGALGALLGRRVWVWWPKLRDDIDSDELAREAFSRAMSDYRLDSEEKLPRKIDPTWASSVYLLLRRLFPPEKDEPIPKGGFTPTSRMEIARWRDSLPRLLAAQGTEAACIELEKIAGALTPNDRVWMRWHLFDGITALRRRAWVPCRPEVVAAMAADAGRRFLRTEDDLLALVAESLGRMAATPDSRVEDFMVKKASGKWVPEREERITEYIAGWLRLDLRQRHGITVQREVRVQRRHRTDIEVRTVGLAGTRLRPLEIVVEVKGDWNRELRGAIRTQLVGRYLKKAGRTHGLYAVIRTGRRVAGGLTARTAEEAGAEVAAWAETDTAGTGFVVTSVVIDAARD